MNRDSSQLPTPTVRARICRGLAAAAVAVSVVLCSLPTATADDLDDRRDELDRQMARQADVVEGASAHLQSAVRAHDAAQAELTRADAELAAAERETGTARELDKRRAAELKRAEIALSDAKAEVAAAQAAYDSVDRRTVEEITEVTQQSGAVVDLALLFTDVDMANLNQRAQIGTTLLNGSALELDELQERRFRLDAAQTRAQDAEQAATAAREASAAQLADTRAKENRAQQARDDRAAKLSARDAARGRASVELGAEKQRQHALQSEADQVDQRIAERIARQKAAEEAARRKAAQEAAEEAARKKAAAEARARDAAAERRAAANAREAAQSRRSKPAIAEGRSEAAGSRPTAKRSVSSPPVPRKVSTSRATSPRRAADSSFNGFLRPVQGRQSSPYGMRLHPVLGYWKLHDGADFAAECGTPLRAAYSGTVAERYFNAGYGNRLMIDHGKVDGHYLTTGYNHATRYTVGVGERVQRGQVIGYVGTTGYSTGCHLHLMTWQDGSKVNPMSRWFD